jgi:MFS family permease
LCQPVDGGTLALPAASTTPAARSNAPAARRQRASSTPAARQQHDVQREGQQTERKEALDRAAAGLIANATRPHAARLTHLVVEADAPPELLASFEAVASNLTGRSGRDRSTTGRYVRANHLTGTSAIGSRHSPGIAEARATRIAFFVAGFANSAWAALVPFAAARANLGNGALGLLLLCLGAGSIVAMPIAGACTARFGCRCVIIVAALVVTATLPLLATFSALPLLVVTLIMFGAGIGAIDVAMNIQAIITERASGRSMMSGFHGLFSLGGIAGAGGMVGLLISGASPVVAAACVSFGVLAAVGISCRNLLPYGSANDGPVLAVPHGIVLVCGLLCFVLFLAEGAVLDWSAIFLTSIRHLAISYAGLGYAVFAAMMTVCRLAGDRIVDRLGPKRVVLIGGMVAATGFVLAAMLPSWQVTLLGYAVVGAGCANIVPVLFSAVGRQSVTPENVAVPAISILGYAGLLAGPAGIGFIAHVSNLPAAFLVLAVMLLAVSLSSRIL